MKELEEKILKEGKVYPGHILKVSSFLNHRIDVEFMVKMGDEIANLYQNTGITKILTIEASGIAIAMAAAIPMHVPVVFAKKSTTSNLNAELFTTVIHSYTHNKDYHVVVSKEFLNEADKVLVVDDFLANGAALNGLIDIVHQARAELIGAAIAIEKGFQKGGDELRDRGVRIESLAIIESMSDDGITFRSDK